METYTIGQLAHDAGVNVETIRFYERRGLLRDPPRSPSGYRQYSDDDLALLEFITRAKRLGFTLAEIAGLIGQDAWKGPDSVVVLAQAKLQVLEERRRALDETQSRLQRLIRVCQDPTSQDCQELRVSS